jgi:hypothetical protein
MKRRQPPDRRAPTRTADSEAVRRIVVQPDQVSQPDPRPWRVSRLHQIVGRYLLLSALLVAMVTGALVLLLRWTA